MSRPRLDPYRCKHPKLLPLLRDRKLERTVYRCMVCGTTLTTNDFRINHKLHDLRQVREDKSLGG